MTIALLAWREEFFQWGHLCATCTAWAANDPDCWRYIIKLTEIYYTLHGADRQCCHIEDGHWLGRLTKTLR